MDRLAFEPEVDRVAMVGDRRFDIEAGQSRGVETIGVTWGFGTRRELLDAGADHIVDNPDQIAGIAFSVD